MAEAPPGLRAHRAHPDNAHPGPPAQPRDTAGEPVPCPGAGAAGRGPREVLVEQRGAIRRLTLNRPHRRNALTPTLIASLREAVLDADADAETSAVVITGSGRSFCAGADLHHLRDLAVQGSDPVPFLRAVSECFTVIEEISTPVIAALHGHCVAGGLELALACDVILAERGTLIGDGHVRNGLIPAGGASVRLPRRLPEPVARWLMLSGELVPAERLAAYGFLHAVAEPGRLEEAVSHTANTLSAAHRPAQQAVKRLLNQLNGTPPRQALEHELIAFAAHWATTDLATPLSDFARAGPP